MVNDEFYAICTVYTFKIKISYIIIILYTVQSRFTKMSSTSTTRPSLFDVLVSLFPVSFRRVSHCDGPDLPVHCRRVCNNDTLPVPIGIQGQGKSGEVQNSVDLYLDVEKVLWVPDTGMVQTLDNDSEPLRTGPRQPYGRAFDLNTSKVIVFIFPSVTYPNTTSTQKR